MEGVRTQRSRFAAQMALDAEASQQGRYHTDLDPKWNCPIVPHGGVVTSVLARAMEEELGIPAQRLRSITSAFAAMVHSGPVEIDVTVLRRGRSMSQATATLRNVGEAAGTTAVAVFGTNRPGFDFTDLRPPDVPPAEACPSFRDDPPEGVDPGPHFEFWQHVEGRAALGHAPWEEYEPTTSQRAYWYRFDEPPITENGVLDPLALVTLCDTMPGAVAERLGPQPQRWAPPSADLTVHVFADTSSEWILAHNHARWAGDGYASLEMELWDPDGRLLAYGTQLMFFTFPGGTPPGPAETSPAPR